jgi:hypothetical protein
MSTKKYKKGLKLSTVQAIWNDINEKVFDGRLRPVVIRITRSVHYYGTCVRREADAGKRLAIHISGPLHVGSGLDATRIRDTMAHEMVHQWQYENGLRYNEHDETFTQWIPKIKEALGIELQDTWSNND